MPLHDAATKLGLCATAIKKACRRFGILRWPFRDRHRIRSSWGSDASETLPSTKRQERDLDAQGECTHLHLECMKSASTSTSTKDGAPCIRSKSPAAVITIPDLSAAAAASTPAPASKPDADVAMREAEAVHTR